MLFSKASKANNCVAKYQALLQTVGQDSMPCQVRTLAPTAIIRFSYVMDSPSAVLSCFLLTSTSDTWTPVRNSMSARTTHKMTCMCYQTH